MARLLRLTRMARMMRLLRAVPELMILIKGLIAGTASVCMTFALLMLSIYVTAIFCVSLASDYENLQDYFGSVPAAMYTLLMRGTFLEDFKDFMDLLRQESYFLFIIFFIFVIGAGITIMNMLIGVLCEVINTVADQEREEMEVNFVKMKLFEILIACFPDKEGQQVDKIQMTQPQFAEMIAAKGAARLLDEVGVNVENLVDLTDMIFERSDASPLDSPTNAFQTFDDLIAKVMNLRGSNTATVRDVMSFRKFATNTVGLRISRIEKALLALKVTNHWMDHRDSPRRTSAQEASRQIGGKWKKQVLEKTEDIAAHATEAVEEAPVVGPESLSRQVSNPSIVAIPNEESAEASSSICPSPTSHRPDQLFRPDSNQDLTEESARIDAAVTEILQELMSRVEHMEAVMQEVLAKLPPSPLLS